MSALEMDCTAVDSEVRMKTEIETEVIDKALTS